MTNLQNNYPLLSQDNLDAIAQIMSDDMRDAVHTDLGDCHPGEFLTAYVDRDESFVEVLKQFNTGAQSKITIKEKR